jgi:hypothetical protein
MYNIYIYIYMYIYIHMHIYIYIYVYMQVLGCGVVQQPILDGCGMSTKHGCAFRLF